MRRAQKVLKIYKVHKMCSVLEHPRSPLPKKARNSIQYKVVRRKYFVLPEIVHDHTAVYCYAKKTTAVNPVAITRVAVSRLTRRNRIQPYYYYYYYYDNDKCAVVVIIGIPKHGEKYTPHNRLFRSGRRGRSSTLEVRAMQGKRAFIFVRVL